ncbi:unnamed protein product [Cuscuta campestris]|uniref:RNase H type-1 domain-containing protein n=1 Tax=Cuscuta campestris TaxID=132261 RepID=A0A484KZP7_9ASTE|nr:unnamed protein product [Cuscuta campestris]
MDLLQTLFSVEEVQEISRIPLGLYSREDAWIWRDDLKGLYSVKHGYRMMYEERWSGTTTNNDMWAFIWKMQVPPKVRNFMWRALNDVLPVRANLRRRQVEVADVCPRCCTDQETTIHSLIGCTFSQACLGRVGYVSIRQYGSMVEWFEEVRRTLTKERVQQLCMVLWEAWQQRNQLVWKNRSLSITFVAERAIRGLQEWQAARPGSLEARLGSGDRMHKWRAPVRGVLKCNVDASFNIRTSVARVGVVVQDDQGNFLRGAHFGLGRLEDAQMAEATGLREALRWLRLPVGQMNLSVEIDSEVVLKAIQEDIETHSHSYFLDIISDCKIVMRDFVSLTLSVVKRSANQVAHMLARASDSESDCLEWIHAPPAFLYETLYSDLN